MVERALLPRHHPADERLLDYGSGALPEPMSLLVATHLALCPRCREVVKDAEAIGGAFLREAGEEPVNEDALARMLARLDVADPEPDTPPPGRASADMNLPQPLRDYVGGSLDALEWRRLGPVSEARILREREGFTTRLLSVKASAALPQHTHAGSEATLVLRGGFRDSSGHFLAGDVAEADSDFDHAPVADADEDCLCLIVTDAPLELTGRVGRLLNRFIRI